MSVILLATDGSEEASRAAEDAVALAKERDATLHVLCVVDRRRFDEPALSTEELATVEAEDHGREWVVSARVMAEEAGVAAESTVRHGIPHEAIVEYAEAVGAEVIVVGEHGDHTEHFGGVGQEVTEHADCEVRVVG